MPDPRRTTTGAPAGSDESGAFPAEDALFNNLVGRSLTILPSSPYAPTAAPGGLDVSTLRVKGPGPWIDVTHPAFGAKGNNVVNIDGAAINSAIAAAPATGGTVLIPPTAQNIYALEQKIIVNKINVTLLIMGGVMLQPMTNMNDDVLWVQQSNVLVWGGGIIDGNKANNGGTNMRGVIVDVPGGGQSISGVTIFAIAIQNCTGDGVAVRSGVAGKTTNDTLVERVSVDNISGGITALARPGGGTVDMFTVRACTINNTVQHGVLGSGVNRVICESCKFLFVGSLKVSGFSHAIAIDGNAGAMPNGQHKISKAWVFQPYDAGIEIADGITSATVLDSDVIGAGNGASAVATYGFYFGGGFLLSNSGRMNNCRATLCKGNAFMFSGVDATHLTTDVRAMGCTATANGNDGFFFQFVEGWQIEGCTGQNNSTTTPNSFSGLDVFTCTSGKAIGNDFQGKGTNQSRGINERGASDFNDFAYNDVRGNVASPFIFQTGAHSTFRFNRGFNPIGALPSFPAFPATTVTITNNQGVDVDYYITAGAGTILCKVDGVTLFTIPNASVAMCRIPAGSTFTPTYTVSPALVVPYGE